MLSLSEISQFAPENRPSEKGKDNFPVPSIFRGKLLVYWRVVFTTIFSGGFLGFHDFHGGVFRDPIPMNMGIPN